jgi:DNA-directed RNA polymerase subunit RPC12/RpoP
MLCPECGYRVHRSHAKGFNERLVRVFTHYRSYRCNECGWRGWLSKEARVRQPVSRQRIAQILLTLLAIIIITFMTLYIVKD